MTLRIAEAAGMTSFEILLLPREPYEASYVAPCGVIGFAFESQSGVHAFASDRRIPFRARPNSLSYIPRGCDVYSHSHDGGEYLLIRAGTWAPPQPRRFNDMMAPGALEAACRIRCDMLAVQPASVLDIEEPVHALVAAVTTLCGATKPEQRGSAWMTQRRLRLIDELIDAHMQTGLTVSDLAARLGLSLGFFIRAFRLGVGRTPHDYIMERRVSRARGLLRCSDMALAEIAAECGFASQAHMSTVFKRRLNLTPGALRNLPALRYSCETPIRPTPVPR